MMHNVLYFSVLLLHIRVFGLPWDWSPTSKKKRSKIIIIFGLVNNLVRYHSVKLQVRKIGLKRIK
jgi:hypothetical protein